LSGSKIKLRSAQWFGTVDKNGFMHRSWMKNQGIPDHEFSGEPFIGICNTWSELTPCNAHFRSLAERVKLDCDAGRLHLDVAENELQSRPSTWRPRPHLAAAAGYQKLYVNHVLQADEGCDFDFLIGCRGAAVPRHSH
jgi:dihydroxyacid dehydratase/phosphogluconate dehydratase